MASEEACDYVKLIRVSHCQIASIYESTCNNAHLRQSKTEVSFFTTRMNINWTKEVG